jgi:SAM-dependent methyltransferase
MTISIKDYYDKIAKVYDISRFNNSYGQFIHQQETNLLKDYLKEDSCTLDIACGTGRFMKYCKVGLDLSPNMLDIARKKFPNKDFIQGDYLSGKFHIDVNNIICFHLLMHLEKGSMIDFLEKSWEILPKGGLLVFDIPSAERRQIIPVRSNSWHGSSAFKHKEILNFCQAKWQIRETRGVLFLPIQRLSNRLRKRFFWFDSLMNTTWLKKWSSYRIYVLEKK